MARIEVSRTGPLVGWKWWHYYGRGKLRPHWAGGPASLSFPSKISFCQDWIKTPDSSVLRSPSSENESGNWRGRQQGGCNASLSLCCWVTSNHHRKEFLLHGDPPSTLQAGLGVEGGGLLPSACLWLDDTSCIFCWGLYPSTGTCFPGRLKEGRLG